MVRKIYDGYDYIDPDNLYTYPHSSVLINKFNEKNDNKARELEYRLVASQSLKLFVNPIEVNTVSDILKIHKFLFEGMYTWAGQYRQVNISKSGNAFMPVQSFDTAEKYLNTLISNYLLNSNNKIEICKSLAEILDNLNYFHPFREGNGRTARLLASLMAQKEGFSPLNFKIITEDKFTGYVQAVQKAADKDYSYMEKIIRMTFVDESGHPLE